MPYTEKTRTWKDNWNNVIRYVLFPDARQREQMCLPKDVTVTQFIEKYFIEDEGISEIVTDEDVRINHYDSTSQDVGNKNVRGRYKEFDIYVKEKVQHTATNDRLANRYDLIVERLKYQLQRERYVCNLRFEFEDSYNLWTKLRGYRRYHLTFRYKTTV